MYWPMWPPDGARCLFSKIGWVAIVKYDFHLWQDMTLKTKLYYFCLLYSIILLTAHVNSACDFFLYNTKLLIHLIYIQMTSFRLQSGIYQCGCLHLLKEQKLLYAEDEETLLLNLRLQHRHHIFRVKYILFMWSFPWPVGSRAVQGFCRMQHHHT